MGRKDEISQEELQAQSGQEVPDREKKLLYFAAVDGARFRRPVVPGDQLRVEMKVLSWRGDWITISGWSTSTRSEHRVRLIFINFSSHLGATRDELQFLSNSARMSAPRSVSGAAHICRSASSAGRKTRDRMYGDPPWATIR